MRNTMSSKIPSTDLIESLGDLETLFALMRSQSVAIVEIGGLKVVMHPDQPAPLVQRQADMPTAPVPPRSISDDPFLYSDGEVPMFGS